AVREARLPGRGPGQQDSSDGLRAPGEFPTRLAVRDVVVRNRAAGWTACRAHLSTREGTRNRLLAGLASVWGAGRRKRLRGTPATQMGTAALPRTTGRGRANDYLRAILQGAQLGRDRQGAGSYAGSGRPAAASLADEDRSVDSGRGAISGGMREML